MAFSSARVLIALALLAVARAADACTYPAELDCLKAGGREAYAWYVAVRTRNARHCARAPAPAPAAAPAR